MRRALTAAVVVAVALVALSSASASGSHSGVAPLMKFGMVGGPNTLDLTRADTATWVTSASLETLMTIDPSGKLKPWLAQSVTHPNRFVYIYHLRKGVKFWDGSELTAADVANSLNYERFPGALTQYLYGSVRNIVPKDRYTVVVTLKHPDATWPYVPAQYPSEIFEKRFQDAHKTTFGQPGTLVMGTGPYKIDSFNPTTGAELSAFAGYWGPKPTIQHISIKALSDETSGALALRSGGIDMEPNVGDPKAFSATSGGAQIISKPGCQEGFFSMNTSAPPWNDIHVRRAVAYALNRQDYVENVGGFATAITTLIPPIHLDVLEPKAKVDAMIKSLPQYPYNLAKAKAEMAQSAYPNGFSAPFPTIQYQNYATGSQIAAAQLAKIGIKLDVKVEAIGPWVGELAGAVDKRPANFIGGSGCNSPDPGFYPATYLGKKGLGPGGFNISAYAPATVENLITAGVSTSNPAKRFTIYTQLLRRLATDLPYVPVLVKNGNLGIGSKFSWPTYNSTWYNRAWPLEIKPKG
jgi:peptide/nickel transport system substrate-binding protein